ncbi:MAG TPA: tyrosine-type recombinase/integrase [Gaiellaceae bacterium]|nr:tyrosine-type recombinase/integrase [Gaiellaceae bacterium]
MSDMHYVDSVRKPPKTLTEAEQQALLRVTGEHVRGFRDHVIYAFALGTGLREHELAALLVGNVVDDETIVRRFPLRVFKRSAARAGAASPEQEAILPDALRYKLGKFMAWKKKQGESLAAGAPLFCSREGDAAPLTTRQIRRRFVDWQARAGLERRFTFHALRHTALTNLYQATKDIRLVQRVARHVNVTTTTIYAQASDEDVLRAMRAQPC